MKDPRTNFLDNVPCSILSYDDQGGIMYANRTLLQQLNFTIEELAGQNIEKVLTLSSRIFYQTHFSPLLKLQGEVNEVFVTLQSKNGTSIPVLVNASQTIEETRPVNIWACITVQQRKKYEDEIIHAKKVAEEALHKNELLIQSQKQLETSKQELDKQMTQLKQTNNELLQLNDIVAHDLQEPVRKISLYVDMLQGQWPAEYDAKTSASFDIISKSTDRIRTVLQSLQEYLDILTKELKKVPVNLNTLVEEQIAILKSKNNVIALTFITEELPVIEGDIGQLKIIFSELFKNCIDFRSGERDLVIRVTSSLFEENLYHSTDEKYKYVEFARITVEDNGIGFNPAYKDLIFKILKRLDHKRPGLGFGLALCKRVAENHRGYMMASGEEGKGAKFAVTLPVANEL